MSVAKLVAVAIGVGTLATSVVAQTIPEPLRHATVSVRVTSDTSRGIYSYQYRIANTSTNRTQIRHVEVDLTLGRNEARLSREGLVNGPGFRRVTSAANVQQIPMVPVGVTTPNGWTSGLGIARGASQGYARWGSRDEPFRISPGQMLTGLGLTSYGLPGLREVRLGPPIPYDDLPDDYDDPDELAKFVETLIFRTKTVGPKAPPEQFVSLEFLNYLIALLHDSREQGWIRTEGVHKSLLAKLLAAKRALEAGRTQAASGELTAFVNEVQAVSCPEFSCPGNKPLTSEAHALLFFNGQYLRERL